ncbi:MAG: OsmC family protein [Flavobacteriales bacterium]
MVRTGPNGFTSDILAKGHRLTADEPENVGGANAGPDPYTLLMSSLGSCTSMTIKMYADRKKWPLNEVKVHLEHEKVHVEDCENCNEKDKIDSFKRYIELEGDLDEEQRKKLVAIANKCPVHRTLHSDVRVETFEV